MRIRREDVDHVRERTHIEEVIGEHVTLKAAGIGSMKGLCPFHDEKTPSFNVRPPLGRWHCFGCDEGGDVIAFLQRIDHLTFAEAVERLAAGLGYSLRYEDDDGRGPARREQVGQRQRLVEAHRTAAEYYADQLATSPDALAGRRFLAERGFDRDAAVRFGVGFAPRSGEALLRHLRGRAFTEDELVTSGLAGRGQRGLYDRFRGRLVWPIRDLAGDVVGFGARRLFEDDRIEAKYLNTPDTVLYKKSQVLYGLDLAKREVARLRKVVVVEGYTDVMACHLSGVETAVATCGTAFGADHIRIVRRLIGDDGSNARAEVVFTFDGDAAGQKAALRAFEEDQRFVAQTSSPSPGTTWTRASCARPVATRRSANSWSPGSPSSSSRSGRRSPPWISTPPRAGSRVFGPRLRGSPASVTSRSARSTPACSPGGSGWRQTGPPCRGPGVPRGPFLRRRPLRRPGDRRPGDRPRRSPGRGPPGRPASSGPEGPRGEDRA